MESTCCSRRCAGPEPPNPCCQRTACLSRSATENTPRNLGNSFAIALPRKPASSMEAAVGFSFLGKLRVLLGSTPAIRRRRTARSRVTTWSWRRDLNPRPSDYKSDALPAELRQPAACRDAISALDWPRTFPANRAQTLRVTQRQPTCKRRLTPVYSPPLKRSRNPQLATPEGLLRWGFCRVCPQPDTYSGTLRVYMFLAHFASRWFYRMILNNRCAPVGVNSGSHLS